MEVVVVVVGAFDRRPATRKGRKITTTQHSNKATTGTLALA